MEWWKNAPPGYYDARERPELADRLWWAVSRLPEAEPPADITGLPDEGERKAHALELWASVVTGRKLYLDWLKGQHLTHHEKHLMAQQNLLWLRATLTDYLESPLSEFSAHDHARNQLDRVRFFPPGPVDDA